MSNDNIGAFVEIDHAKMSRESLYILGVKEGVERWVMRLQTVAATQPDPGVAQVMREIAAEMQNDLDGIAVALTKVALKDKSGTITKLHTD
jgi:hypothetical protein